MSKTFLRVVYHHIHLILVYYSMKNKLGWKNEVDIEFEDFKKITYSDLESILQVKGRTAYEAVLGKAIQNNLEGIRHRKIKIAFLLYDSSMWCGDELYWLLEADTRFDVEVILSMRQDTEATPLILENHIRGLEMFRKNGICVREDREGKHGDEIEPDILVWCDPYLGTRTQKYRASNIPLTKLMILLPYGIYATRDNILKDNRLNREMFHFAWLGFVETRYIQRVLGISSDAGNSRFYYSGYSKMDAMYSKEKDSSFPWKICAQDVKKIIWSPHWSINQNNRLSTFLLNYKYFYEYAKAHSDTTSWVIKPHPNLLFSSVCEGGFNNVEEAREYFDAWDRLPNAKLVLGGSYSSLFKTSDAMINDGASFMSEYQYVHKPMLYLEQEVPNKNYDFLVKRILYTARGDDYEAIETFINDVVIGGNDYMKEEREAFFEKELDYMKINSVPASDFIYDKIVHEVFG